VTTPAHSAGSTSVVTKSLDDMKSPSVYAHLNKLFNKKAVSKQSLAKTKRRKVESSHDDSDEEAVTPITKKSREKAVTVVCVDPGTTTIPRQKHKRGSMKYLLVSPTDSEEIISRNIRKLFDFDVIVLRATMSNDLFEQKDPINGRKLLDMIGNGCLYVKPSSVPNKSEISEIQLPKPTQVVYPSSADKPDINLELLKKELSDNSLILSYKMDSESYSQATDTYENESLEEGTVQSDISCGSGETLLCRNYVVDMWVDLLHSSNAEIPKLHSIHSNFYIVKEKAMLEFDKFSNELKKIPFEGSIRKKNETIKLWMNEDINNTIKPAYVKVGSETYCVFSFSDMDRLCEFVDIARDKYL
jgi:hypothetical protein